MFKADLLLAFAAIASYTLPVVLATNSKAIPCAVGNGEDSLCDSCEESRAIEVTAWENATWARNFTMSETSSEIGPGYDVYWVCMQSTTSRALSRALDIDRGSLLMCRDKKIDQPAEGCRIMLFESFNTDRGSIDPRIPGKIMLSVNHGGCYMVTIGARGVAAGACCWDECKDIGAAPGNNANAAKRTLPAPRSRITRSKSMFTQNLRIFDEYPAAGSVQKDELTWRRSSRNAGPKIGIRGSGGQHPDPFNRKPSKNAVWNCKADKTGPSYSKSGKQQVDGRTFPCRTLGCDMSIDFTITASSTVSSEKSTTFTNSEGLSIDVTAGWMYAGPTCTTTLGYSKEFSEAVSSSTSTSQTDTESTSVSWRQQVMPGATYNGWWAPTLRCQIYDFSCNDGKEFAPMEKCEPWLDGSGKPVGEQGIMITGSS